MKKRKIKSLPTLLAIGLLSAGVLGAIIFMKTKPQASKGGRPVSSMIPVVETIAFSLGKETVHVNCLGTVIPDKEVIIQAELSGRIIQVNPDLVEGQLVKKGELLLEIDPTDYRLQLAQAKTDLLKAQSELRIEQGQQDVVRHELDIMGSDKEDPYLDLTLREPQLKSAEAAVEAAQLAVEKAEVDLARTKIYAPFDSVVINNEADLGDYAQVSKELIELASIDRYFIRASVPMSALQNLPQLGSLEYQAQVTASDKAIYHAKTYRILADLSETGRMARILIAVDNPYSKENKRPLLLNEYVQVDITAKEIENVAKIDREYLRDGNVIYMMDKERKLKVLPVTVVQGSSDDLIIQVEGSEGKDLITSELSVSVDGMQLRLMGEKTTAPNKAMGKEVNKNGENKRPSKDQAPQRPDSPKK